LKFEFSPVWQHDLKKVIELLAMVGMFEVTEFMGNDVIDAGAGSADEVAIEAEITGGSEATPTVRKLTND
jgi:hypothetical protein